MIIFLFFFDCKSFLLPYFSSFFLTLRRVSVRALVFSLFHTSSLRRRANRVLFIGYEIESRGPGQVSGRGLEKGCQKERESLE